MLLLLVPLVSSISGVASATSQSLTAAQFDSCFGGQTVAQQGDVVVLTRTKAGGDNGCDFVIMAPLDALHARIEIRPKRAINGGWFVVTALIHDRSGKFLTEPRVVDDTDSAEPRIVPDLRVLVRRKGITGGAQYKLRFRIQPVDRAGAAFAFRRIVIGAVR